MLGVLVNTLTVLIGSLAGLLLRRGIPQRLTGAVMNAVGLCTLAIGITGAMKGENTLILICSLVVGTVPGTLLRLDERLNCLGERLTAKVKKTEGTDASPAEGFVTAGLLFCVGAMTVVGSIEAGVSGDNTMLFTKSLLDLISSSMLAVSLGIGVLLAAVTVFLWQGTLVLLAGWIAPLMSPALINELSCTGSVIILALGLNLLGITKIKIVDLLPALLFVPLFYALFSFVG